MDIPGIDPGPGLVPFQPLSEPPSRESSAFAKQFHQFIETLNATQQKSAQLSERFAAGENLELHDVMIASQEADIAMRLAVSLRNQALEAYREIMRMPI